MSVKKIFLYFSLCIITLLIVLISALLMGIHYINKTENISRLLEFAKGELNKNNIILNYKSFDIDILSQINFRDLNLEFSDSKSNLVRLKIPEFKMNYQLGFQNIIVSQILIKEPNLKFSVQKINNNSKPTSDPEEFDLESFLQEWPKYTNKIPVSLEIKEFKIVNFDIKGVFEDHQNKNKFMLQLQKLNMSLRSEVNDNNIFVEQQIKSLQKTNKLLLVNNKGKVILNPQISILLKYKSFKKNKKWVNEINVNNKFISESISVMKEREVASIFGVQILSTFFLKKNKISFKSENKISKLNLKKYNSINKLNVPINIKTNTRFNPIELELDAIVDNEKWLSANFKSSPFLKKSMVYTINVNLLSKLRAVDPDLEKNLNIFGVNEVLVKGELESNESDMLSVNKLAINGQDFMNAHIRLAIDKGSDQKIKSELSVKNSPFLREKIALINKNFIFNPGKNIEAHIFTKIQEDVILNELSLLTPDIFALAKYSILNTHLKIKNKIKGQKILGEMNLRSQVLDKKKNQLNEKLVLKSDFSIEKNNISISNLIFSFGSILSIEAFLRGDIKKHNFISEGELKFNPKNRSLKILDHQLSGKITSPWSLSVKNGKKIEFETLSRMSHFSMDSKNIKWNELNGELFITESFNLTPKGLEFSKLHSSNAFTVVDFSSVQPLLTTHKPMTLKSLQIYGKKYGPNVFHVHVDQNLLSVSQFQFKMPSGLLLGEMSFNLSQDNLKMGLLCRVQDMNLGKNIPRKFMGDDESSKSSFDTRMGLTIDFSRKNLEGRIDVTKMDGAQLTTMLNILDPEYTNKDFNLVRKALKIGYPTFVGLEFLQGFLNLDLRINGIAPYTVRGVPVSALINSELDNLLNNKNKEDQQ